MRPFALLVRFPLPTHSLFCKADVKAVFTDLALLNLQQGEKEHVDLVVHVSRFQSHSPTVRSGVESFRPRCVQARIATA